MVKKRRSHHGGRAISLLHATPPHNARLHGKASHTSVQHKSFTLAESKGSYCCQQETHKLLRMSVNPSVSLDWSLQTVFSHVCALALTYSASGVPPHLFELIQTAAFSVSILRANPVACARIVELLHYAPPQHTTSASVHMSSSMSSSMPGAL